MKQFLIFSAVLFLSGCGTVFSGTNQTVTVNANVERAKVYVNGMPACSTPCAVDLNRSNINTTLILKKDGYEESVFVLKSQFNPIALINLTMVYSWTTDFISGGVWRYSPDSLYVEMEKSNMTQAERGQFKKTSEVSRFILFNFYALKSGSAEHLHSLAKLSGLNEKRLKHLLLSCFNEIDAVRQITAAG